MRALLSIIILMVPVMAAYGQTAGEIGYRFVPSKMVSGTEGTLQVFIDGAMPRSIDGLVATSSDPSIVKIVGIEQDSDSLFTVVKISAIGKGDAQIALAAPGVSPQEIPITVYPNNSAASQILIKATPDVFSTKSSKTGYVSVEMASEDGIPLYADKDTVVNLSTPNPDVISFRNSSLVIKSGDYFASGQFDIKQSGKASIFASSSLTDMASTVVSDSSEVEQLSIRSYIYPQTINDFSSSVAYLIVQLVDSSGNPVPAKEDIPISVRVKDPTQEETPNSSAIDNSVRPLGSLVIKEKSYYAYIPVSVQAGLTSSYDVSVFAKDYIVPPPLRLSTVFTQKMDTKSAKIDLLPILATGKEELVGVLHLEDTEGVPILSSGDIVVKVDSSDPNTLSISGVKVSRGDSAALVFGKTAKISNPVTLTVITKETQTLTPQIILPEDELSLIAQPIIQKVLSNTVFPIAIYLSHPDGTAEYAPANIRPVASPKEFVAADDATLQKGKSVALMSAEVLKRGAANLSFIAGEYSASTSIDALANAPSSAVLNYPESILSNTKNIFAVEILDDGGFPVFANEDLDVKMVSSDPHVINITQNIIIKKGSYYTLLDVPPSSPGSAEISVLTNGMPMAKFDLTVTGLDPQIDITSADQVNSGSVFDATLSAKYDSRAVPGLKVDWNVQGASVQRSDPTTDEDGKATISLASTGAGKISLGAKVSGGSFVDTTVSREITVNMTQQVQPQVPPQQESFSIMGINPAYIAVSGAAPAAIFVLKKKNYLDGLAEKMSFLSKISDMKDRISQIRK